MEYRIYRKRRTRLPKRKKRKPEPKFYRKLAAYEEFCGICNTPFGVGAPIYFCKKTTTTRTMCCHEACYLERTGQLAPLDKPSPSEGELRQMREAS